MSENHITAYAGRTIDWLWDETPLRSPGVEAHARLLLLDTHGCAVAGLAKPELQQLNERFGELEHGPVRLPGSTGGLGPAAAAFLLGTAACWDEACEGLARAHGRPGLHGYAPAYALGIARHRTVAEVLAALVRGFEVGGRLGERLRIGPGMHVDGTWGTFAAVAAACSLLQTGPGVVKRALEMAGSQVPYSLYLPVRTGATARNTYVGSACARGLWLAMAADCGITAPPGALDEFDTLALGARGAEADLAPPGVWLIEQGYLKPYAAVRHVHYGAEAARRWQARCTDPGSIRALRLRIYAEALTYCANRAPDTPIQAQFSLSYGAAWTLCHGDLGPDAYTPGGMADPQVRRLERLLVLEEAAELTANGERGAELTVTTAEGEETIAVDAVAGDPSMPLGEDATREKFLRYAAPHLGTRRAEAVAHAILHAPLETDFSTALDH